MLRIVRPDIGPDEMTTDSCSLDVADRGPHTLEDVADSLNITREGARVAIDAALAKVRAGFGDRCPDTAEASPLSIWDVLEAES